MPCIVAALAATAVLGGCSGGTDPVRGNVVPDNRVTSVAIDPASASIVAGADVTLRATAYNASGREVVGQAAAWSSSAVAIASVSVAGVVTGVSAGTATITATVAGISGSAPVTVTPAAADTVVASVTVSPATASVQTGATIALGAVAQNAAGQAIAGKTFTWASAASAIASVSSGGIVTGIAPGTAVITATADGKSASATITVTAIASDAVASIVVLPSSATLIAGTTAALGVIARNAAGQQLHGKTFSWSSSAPAIAAVSATGTVTAAAVGGPVTITVSAEGKSANADITIVPTPTSLGTITVNSAQQYQTMTGWEALMEIGQSECDPRAYQSYKNNVLDRAANEVGINRIRMGLRNGYENTVDQFLRFQAGQLTFRQWNATWFQVVNDNNDPFVINPAGFNWGYLDYTIEELIIPLRQRLRARGDDLWFNLSYTGANSGQLHRDNPEEYAEFVLAAFQHIQQKYGFVPNSLELVNEPNIGGWSGQQIGQNLVAAKRRLNQAGFFPDFVGPTASAAIGSIIWFDQMIQVPGVAQALNEISYHRFGTDPATIVSQLQQLAQRASQHGMRTAMLEHGGSGHQELHQDLTVANVSAWQQFGLAFCNDKDSGGQYFNIYGAALGSNSPRVETGSLTKYLRQYFRYVAHRALRVGATTADARFAPVAFRNADGRFVVVVNSSAGGTFTVGGLPAGTYGIDYTTAIDYMLPLADVTISGSQAITTAIPAAGVLTIYRR